MRDLYNNIKVNQMLNLATKTADATTASVNMQGYDSLDINVDVGASGDTLSGTVYWKLYLQESDDNTVFSAVADADVKYGSTVTSGLFATIDATDEDSTNFEIGYQGGKRYVHVLIDATGTHTNGTPFSVVGIQGHPALGATK